MKKLLFIAALLPILPMRAALPAETPMLTDEGRPHPIDSVVVTGARYRTDIRHLPMSVSTVDRRR
ncbi:MAG: TonB-dependent receptor, partial [Alistipes sp.]|nr:TonB-dependent receptor [Alistipes sp.]